MLMWIAFWSSMMGAATCWQDAVMPPPSKKKERPDQPAV
jgi:hypothetical protein